MLRSILLWIAIPITALMAEGLPLKRFGLLEGLPSETIGCIAPDSQGYLWLCAGGKLTRFDGAGFKTFTSADGMPDAAVWDIVEFDETLLLLGTANGVVQFRPEAPQSFHLMALPGAPSPPAIRYFYKDRSRNIWAVATESLWRIYRDAAGDIQSEQFTPPMQGNPFERSVNGVLVDAAGTLWIASGRGLLHWRTPSGQWDSQKLLDRCCQRMLEIGPSRAVIVSERGFFELDVAGGKDKISVRQISPRQSQGTMFAGSDGLVWAESDRTLMRISGQPDQRSVASFGPQHGLPKLELRSIAEYPAGTLWLGYARGGLWRYSRTGFYKFSTADGLLDPELNSYRLQPNGVFAVITQGSRKQLALHHWNGARFEGVKPWLPSDTRWSWGWTETAFEDSRGQWWVPTAQGIYRYPKVARLQDLSGIKPDLHLTTAAGLFSDEIFRVYEDSRGDVWIFCAHGESQKTGWCIWRRATQKVERLTQIPNVGWAKSILEDRHGSMWLGMDAALVRYSPGRGATVFPHKDRMAGGPPTSLFEDRQGRIWMGSEHGLLRVDNLDAEAPAFSLYTRAKGLPHDYVDRVAQDRAGNYYLSGPKGVHRFDPASGKTYPIASPEGIPANVGGGVIDRDGNLWFSTDNHLLRYTPLLDAGSPPPRAMLSGVSLGGRVVEIGKRGSNRLGEAGVAKNGAVSVEYTAPQVSAGTMTYYEHKLEGSGQDWSEPAAERSASFALLQPGRYEFLVRARHAPDQPAGPPASFSFTVPAPFYRTWWFLTLCGVMLASIVFAFQQTRIQRLHEIARLRDRIAQDLHDDIGTSLTKIAVLSEVARMRSTNGEQLAEISQTARTAVDSLGYAVWAISPGNDNLLGLIRATRKLAADLFGSGDVSSTVTGPDQDVTLPQDLRRQAFSMLNEALNNAARHSACTEVRVTFAIENDMLQVEVRDDGRGFSPDQVEAGNGLRGLRRRSRDLGGSVEIASAPGNGARVRFALPVRHTFM